MLAALLSDAKLLEVSSRDDSGGLKEQSLHHVRSVRPPSQTGVTEKKFVVDGDQILVQISNAIVDKVPRNVIGDLARQLLREIKTGSSTKSRVFTPRSGLDLVALLHLDRLGSKSENYDLILEIIRGVDQSPTVLGFSIKSELGSPWTLLNASMQTNFIFELEHDYANPIELELPNDEKSVNKNVADLLKSGWKFKFIGIHPSRTGEPHFYRNLADISPEFPKYLSDAVLMFYGTTLNNYAQIIDAVARKSGDPEHVYELFDDFMIRKIQGMVAGTPYVEPRIPLGGVISVKPDGSVRSGTLLDYRQIAKEVSSELKFERPDRRNKFGSLELISGAVCFKLNLQLRKR